MQKIKSIGRAIVNFVEHARLFPQSVAMAIEQRRQQIVFDKCEAERLDRIRNPSKYVGR